MPLGSILALVIGVSGLVVGSAARWASLFGIATGVGAALLTAAYAAKPAWSRFLEPFLAAGALTLMAVAILVAGMMGDDARAVTELVRQSFWLPVVYAFAYLAFGLRGGGLASTGVWLLLAAVAIEHGFGPHGHAVAELAMLREAILANGVVIAVLAAMAMVIRSTQRRAIQLEDVANRDAMTGLSNRRYGERLLEMEVERAARYERPLSVVLFDVDHFKRINDTYGHPVGDRVLMTVARILGDASRESDVLVRWGGEEFLLIVPERGMGEAARLAERLRRTLEESDVAIPRLLTASFGVATLMERESAADVVRRADAAMYAAKQGGRNAVYLSLQDAESGIVVVRSRERDEAVPQEA